MTVDETGKTTSRSAEAQRLAAKARDALVFGERRAQEAANRAKTERLRALRLAHEATAGVTKRPSKSKPTKH